jgi:hypothetical protein
MNVAMALDVLLIVLLLATIVYAMLLSRRLRALRADRDGIDAVVERMNEATRKADASLKGLRQSAEQAKGALDEPMAKAQALRDELAFLVQRADAAGERLADGLSGAGGAVAAPARPKAAPRAGGRARDERAPSEADELNAGRGDAVRSQAERDLMNALRNVR